MGYVNAFTTHFRAVQDWGERTGADLTLDVRRFRLEVKWRGRYFHLFPQFFGRSAGRFGNTETITPSTQGFAGWLPYRPYDFELAQDKLRFKAFCRARGLATPASWPFNRNAAPPDQDFLVKRSVGSYGFELAGPFRASAWPPGGGGIVEGEGGEAFAEQFVHGEILKLWCWGARPFYAQVRPFSRVRGDGQGTAQALAARRLRDAGLTLAPGPELEAMKGCLAYQGLSLDDVLPAGAEPFIDYRYGRDHTGRSRGLASDNDLPALEAGVREQLQHAADRVASALRQSIPAPVLYSLDGVIDAGQRVGWLEMNSNPSLPPDGYAEMFLDLFGG